MGLLCVQVIILTGFFQPFSVLESQEPWIIIDIFDLVGDVGYRAESYEFCYSL